MKNEFLIAITQLCADRNLKKEVVLAALEAALESAYKRNFGSNQDVEVRMDATTGEYRVFVRRQVTDVVEEKLTQISLEDARALKGPGVRIGDIVEEDRTPRDFGRIAAQTAKQVVMQRLRDAERDVVFDEYVDKEGDIVSGTVLRIEPRQIIIDLGRAEAVLLAAEQVAGEQYRLGSRIKAYLYEVHRTPKGPQLFVSRTHRNLLRRLFELEVPEIYNGTVEIKAIAREAGSRSKVAVAARQPGVDPVGACVGLRGIRIQNIVNELNGEKIDVIEWAADPSMFVAKALSPAQVVRVIPNDDDKTATCVVPDRQLSLAIGKEGQNARLAAKLTGWRIDIKSITAYRDEEATRLAEEAAAAPVAPPTVPEPVVAVAPPPFIEPEPLAPPVIVAPPEPSPVFPAPIEPPAAPPIAPVVVEAEPDFGQQVEQYLPSGGNRGQIRFAEEILGNDRDGKRKKDRGRDDEESKTTKKGGGRRARVYFEEDDEEAEYEDILRRIR